MFATAALCVATPLYWASSSAADGATAPVGTLATKDPAGHGSAPDDGPTGDDLDGTTAPGFTTTCVVGDTSTQNTTAPGVTTAPGETTGGDQQTVPGEQPQPEQPQPEQPQPEQPQPEQPQPEQPEQPEQQPPPPPAVQPPPPAPPSVQPPPPPPNVVVAPQPRVSSPTATFRAAGSGCPPQAFNARVTGRRIVRVKFTLDGRHYATVNRPDANGVFKVRVNPARLSRGKHRMVATATFDPAARSALRRAGRQARRVLTVTFTVCARSAQRPNFTG